MKKSALIFEIVSFPAVEAPQDTPFKCYAQKKRKSAEDKGKEKDDANPSSSGMIVVGETDDMEFFSNEGENREAEQSGCRCISPRSQRLCASNEIEQIHACSPQ